MGLILLGLYDKATLFLKEISGIDEFVETGTYCGSTTAWAANHFAHVSTIELSEQLYKKTSERLAYLKNVTFILGDSRNELSKIIERSQGPIIFWLDAHWSGGNTAGEEDQCPLLEELKIIYSSQYEHIVMIDDARTFTLPPRKPNNYNQFPTISDIVTAVQPFNVYLVVLDDVIYLIPSRLRDSVVDFFQDEAAISEDRYWKLLSGTSKNSCSKSKWLKRKVKQLWRRLSKKKD